MASLKKTSPFNVDKVYKVAEFDATQITPGIRPNLLSQRGWKSSVFHYTWRQALLLIGLYYAIQLLYR